MFSGNFWKFVGAFLVIMFMAGGGFFVWDRYFSELARLGREQEAQLNLYQEKEAAYIKAMTEDTYGGKTPQETLDLFVAALRKGDVELASKYFLLDENLSREKWVSYLNDVEQRNLLPQMVSDIKKEAKPFGTSEENRFSYALFNDNGVVEILIAMRFNLYSQVWKIESL